MKQDTSILVAVGLLEAIGVVALAYFGVIAETISVTTMALGVVGLGAITTPVMLKVLVDRDEDGHD